MVKEIRTFATDPALVETRRRQLVDCAIKVFMEKGYEETTMSDISQVCGWSKGLLYHYVSSKEDILYLIADDQTQLSRNGFKELEVRCRDKSPINALLEYIEYYYRAVDRMQNYQVFLNQVAARLPKEDRKILFDSEQFALDVLDSILKRGVQSKEFQADDTILMAHNIMLIGRVWADRRWFLKKHCTLDEYLGAQTNAILRMLCAARTVHSDREINVVPTPLLK